MVCNYFHEDFFCRSLFKHFPSFFFPETSTTTTWGRREEKKTSVTKIILRLGVVLFSVEHFVYCAGCVLRGAAGRVCMVVLVLVRES